MFPGSNQQYHSFVVPPRSQTLHTRTNTNKWFGTGQTLAQYWTDHRLGSVANCVYDDDVIKLKWKHFPRYWPFVRGIHRWQRPVTHSFDVFFDLRCFLWFAPFVRGIHRWLVNPSHKGQWRRALMFSLICARTNTEISKPWKRRWFETPSRSLCRHCNDGKII